MRNVNSNIMKSATNNEWLSPRNEGTRELAKDIYIFCEGTKTEPNYFEGFKRHIELFNGYMNSIHVEIVGTGKNTNGVLEEAKNYISMHNITVGDVGCVFDKDDFKSYKFDNVLNACFDLNKHNRKKRNKIRFYAAWSNQCIEYGFILHFNFYDSDNTRDLYKKHLSKEFSKCGIKKKYIKNDVEIFDILHKYGNPKLALRHANKRIKCETGMPPSRIAPGTNVHSLVKILSLYLPDYLKSKYI